MNVSNRAGSTLVTEIKKAKAILKGINWDFYPKSKPVSHVTSPFDCRKYHWFPATFIPEIPFTLIEVLTLPRAVVYDPFGGIGTTYFQALTLARRPLTTEVNSVAVEYMKCLFLLFNPSISLDKVQQSIKNAIADFDPAKNYVVESPTSILVDRLKPWYSEKTMNELSFLFIKEAACTDKIMKAAMRIGASAILKIASSQNRGWGCIADNVLPKKDQIKDKEALITFASHVGRLIRDVSNHLQHVPLDYPDLYAQTATQETIVHTDVRDYNDIKDESVDLVVTSPPYPNMTDYVTSQRLSYYFMGMDLSQSNDFADLKSEIGARSRRTRRDALERYLADMQKANENVARRIKLGGYACYVMPGFDRDSENNKARAVIIQSVMSDMDSYNLSLEDSYERVLPARRRSHNAHWAKLERETIFLFRKV
jgi:DNA modification methylase